MKRLYHNVYKIYIFIRLVNISDVIMPTMNGREMVERIRNIRPDIRVLFISGYTSDIIASKGVLESGMNFLMKPFSMTSLNDKIDEVLREEFTGQLRV